MKKLFIILLLFIGSFVQAQDTRVNSIRPGQSWLVDSLRSGRYNVSLFTDYGFRLLVNGSKKFEIDNNGIFNYFSGIHNFKNGSNVQFGTTDNYSLYLKTADTNRIEITNRGDIKTNYQRFDAPNGVWYRGDGDIYRGSNTWIRGQHPARYTGTDQVRSYDTVGVDNVLDSIYPTENTNIFIGKNTGVDESVILNWAQRGFQGNHNVGIGNDALKELTYGYYNFAMGLSSLGSLTYGSNNLGLGNFTMRLLTTGVGNTAVGNNSMYNAGPVSYANTMIGSGSGYGLTGNSYYINVGVGGNALYNVTTGLRNIGIGASALFRLTDGKGNIQIGSSTYSIYNQSFTDTTKGIRRGNNNILIGDTLWTSSSWASNEMNIQRTLYGTGMGIDTARIGIMTSVPNSTLQITGSIAFRDTVVSTQTYTLNPKDNMVVMTYTFGTDTVIVPTATVINGREYVIKNAASANNLVVRTTSSQYIDDYASNAIVLAYNECLVIRSIGTAWIIKSWYKP